MSNINGPICVCPTGYTGRNCQTVINSCQNTPCQNDGICSPIGTVYICTCLPGYTGRNCELTVSLCASNPCSNGGMCNQVNPTTGYTCTCLNGY